MSEKYNRFQKAIIKSELAIRKGTKSIASKLSNKLSKLSKGKSVNKEILKSSRATIRLNQRVYTEDKPRYYKTAWEEEKKQLFFD